MNWSLSRRFTTWCCGRVCTLASSRAIIALFWGNVSKQRLYELLETLITAKYSRERAALLKHANLTIEILRFQMRLAKDLQCLTTNSFGHAIRQRDEIGRTVGGWRPAAERGKRRESRGDVLRCRPNLEYGATAVFPCGQSHRSMPTPGLPHGTTCHWGLDQRRRTAWNVVSLAHRPRVARLHQPADAGPFA